MGGLVIAGTHSGCGKTTVTVGLLAALAREGLDVRPFKVGPDFIDPMFHERATGRASRNLDVWLMGIAGVRRCFARHAGGDIAIVEGVMGLFDGSSATSDRGSTAELAKLLGLPVILVVDASAMARSAAALVRGFQTFNRQLRPAGVIFNRVGGPAHARLLRRACRGIPVIGCLPEDPDLRTPERHLGLVPPAECRRIQKWIQAAADAVSQSVDLPALRHIARRARFRSMPARPNPPPERRIGLADDEAFSFHYADNLDLLRRRGFEIVRFSPLRDRTVPRYVQALIVDGGFPEQFAARLARNRSMIRSMRRSIAAGLPVYAECGGLMYLVEELVDFKGRRHRMVGSLPGRVEMTPRLQGFGYKRARVLRNTPFLRKGQVVRGHEFHYSRWTHDGRWPLFAVGGRRIGYARANLHASYLHLHLGQHRLAFLSHGTKMPG